MSQLFGSIYIVFLRYLHIFGSFEQDFSATSQHLALWG